MSENNHLLKRTVPKGEIGPWRCAYCGEEGSPSDLFDKPCESGPATQEEALLDALSENKP